MKARVVRPANRIPTRRVVLAIGGLGWLALTASPGAAQELSARDFWRTCRTNDTVALIGGEDIAAWSANCYLELLLSLDRPASMPRLRNLGWEGDTAFEQRRDLNFGDWQEQLSRAKATRVICQFGQIESLGGEEKLASFLQAYARLIDGFQSDGRRVLVLSPTPFEACPGPGPDLSLRNAEVRRYTEAVATLARENRAAFVDVCHPLLRSEREAERWTRDGIHLNDAGHWQLATVAARALGAGATLDRVSRAPEGGVAPARWESVRQRIQTKNRLWFEYWRPMNWAFLKGDRVEQPSSRDHRDPSVRWFPKEMEAFLPLIASQEQAIAAAVVAP